MIDLVISSPPSRLLKIRRERRIEKTVIRPTDRPIDRPTDQNVSFSQGCGFLPNATVEEDVRPRPLPSTMLRALLFLLT